MGELNEPVEVETTRPRTRAECRYGLRPCPYIACKWHLAEPVVSQSQRPRSLRVLGIVIPDSAEPAEVEAITDQVAEAVVSMGESCGLDVIEREPDGATLEAVGQAFGVTRERIRQIETKTVRTLRRSPRARRLR